MTADPASIVERVHIRAARLTVELSAVWSLEQPLAPTDDLEDFFGAFLRHAKTDIMLDIRSWRTIPPAGLAAELAEYAATSWPGSTYTVTAWRRGALHGVTAVFFGAMPGGEVREWFVTDGSSSANAATCATAEQWAIMLADCDELVTSVRFDYGSAR